MKGCHSPGIFRFLPSHYKEGERGPGGAALFIETDRLRRNRSLELKENGKMKWMATIRRKLTVAFLIPVLFIVILGIASYQAAAGGLTHNYEQGTMSNLSNMGKYLDFGLDMVESKGTLLNSMTTLRNYYSGYYSANSNEETAKFREVQQLVYANVLSEKYIKNIYVFADHGTGISANGTLAAGFLEEFGSGEEKKAFDASGANQGWIGRHPFIDEKMVAAESGYALSYISKLFNESNQPIGYIMMDVPMDTVTKMLSDSGLPKEAALGYITADGREIATGTIPKKFQFTSQKFYQKAKESKETSGFEYINIGSERYLIVFSKEKTAGGMLTALIPQTVIMGQASGLRSLTTFLVLFCGVVAIFLGYWIATDFSKAIDTTNRVIASTAKGDLTGRLRLRRKDEFFVLGTYVNEMIDNMKNLIYKMQNVSTTVYSSAFEVAQSTDSFVDSTNHIAQALQDIEQGTGKQAEDAEECLLKIIDLSRQMELITGRITEIEESAENTKLTADEGVASMHRLQEKVQDSNLITNEIVGDTKALETEVDAMFHFIHTIKEIAEQTQLLSLNASIEAARAGEEGRGFAVVADEIGKLSTHSKEATKEMDVILTNVRAQMIHTSGSARRAQSNMSNQEEALANAVTLFRDIDRYIGELAQKVEGISNGVLSMNQSKNETLAAIESISATSEETAAAASQLTQVVINQEEAVQMLKKSMGYLGEDADRLKEAVGVFRVEKQREGEVNDEPVEELLELLPV